jgi:hypothetical protein
MGGETRIREVDELSKPTLQIGYAARVVERTDQDLWVRVRAEATVRDTAVEASETAIRVFADFELHYRLPEGISATDEEASIFAETNATLNAWPYLRETIQSTSVRMGVPPILLPLFRLPVARQLQTSSQKPDTAVQGQRAAGAAQKVRRRAAKRSKHSKN